MGKIKVDSIKFEGLLINRNVIINNGFIEFDFDYVIFVGIEKLFDRGLFELNLFPVAIKISNNEKLFNTHVGIYVYRELIKTKRMRIKFHEIYCWKSDIYQIDQSVDA